jgi:hypothetical protein
MKVAAKIAHLHINKGAPEYTIPKEAMLVTRPRYPSA